MEGEGEGHKKPVQSGANRRLSPTSGKGAALFGCAVVLALIASNALHGYVHEALGHGLFSLLMGGFFDGFYVSPFSVSYSIAYVFSDHGLDAVRALAGTAVSSAAGFAILYLIYPRFEKKKSFQWSLASLIAAATFQADWVYAFFSVVGRVGDMNTVVTKLQIDSSYVSVIALAIIVAVYYPIFTRLLRLLAPYYYRSPQVMMKAGFSSNFRVLFLNIGIPVLIYAAILELYSPILNVFFSTPVEHAPGIVMIGILTIFIPMAIVAWKRRHEEYHHFDVSSMMTGESNGERTKTFDLKAIAVVSVVIIVVNLALMGPQYYISWGIFWDEHPWYYNINVKMDSMSSAIVTVKSLPGWGDNSYWSVKASTAEGSAKYDHYVESAAAAASKMFALAGQEPSVKVLQTYTLAENEKGYFVHTGNIYSRPLRVVELEVSDIHYQPAASKGEQGKVVINTRWFDSVKSRDSSQQDDGYSQLQMLSVSSAIPGIGIVDYGPKDGIIFKRSAACTPGELCNNIANAFHALSIIDDGSVYWLKQHDNYEVIFGR